MLTILDPWQLCCPHPKSLYADIGLLSLISAIPGGQLYQATLKLPDILSGSSNTLGSMLP